MYHGRVNCFVHKRAPHIYVLNTNEDFSFKVNLEPQKLWGGVVCEGRENGYW